MSDRYKALVSSICVLVTFCYQGCQPKGRALKANVPLHLEDHIAAARITGTDLPKNMAEPIEWRFAEDLAGWKATVPLRRGLKQARTSHEESALRMTLTKENRTPYGYRMGSVYVDVPNLNHDDWEFIVIEVRTKDEISWISPAFNLSRKKGDNSEDQSSFEYWGDDISVIKDGKVHAYVSRIGGAWPVDAKAPWTALAIAAGSSAQEKADSTKGPISLDILSVSVLPKEAAYAASKAGISEEPWDKTHRRVLYTHVPGKIGYDVRIPDRGRLDVGLGVLKKNLPVKFKISALEMASGARPKVLLEETGSANEPWVQRSVDLSALAGKAVTLSLETEATRAGNIAFWAAPTLSGARTSARPNVVFYIIDGAAAEFMSAYGYNRRTTPHLERLAAEGAVFEHAYSNSSWTKVSVTSFMTSLHNSALGGDLDQADPLPAKAVTMAERMHQAGYVTEVLTSNPYCGRMSSLDRGVDILRDSDPEAKNEKPLESTSEILHRAFWDIREAYPAEPYWVYFQPTDVHWPWRPLEPFAGLFATAEERKALDEMMEKMNKLPMTNFDDVIDKAGVDKELLWQLSRKVYDECMAHQDAAIGRLIDRIKESGEWSNTLFVVAADHSHESARLTLFDPRKPPKYFEPNLASQVSWIPMMFVWQGRIRPGLRLTEPVSMIDMLPTILDLAGLPPMEVTQGQSLAPLLLGTPGWTQRPVVFDEFFTYDKQFVGSIDVIDGRWGASLEIDPRPKDKKNPLEDPRPVPLLIFDVWNDPHAFKSLHAERPDLVEKYTKMLEGIWKEHQALAKKFSRAAGGPLSQEQIETLRSLGYVR